MGAGKVNKSPKSVNPKDWPHPSGYSTAVIAEGKIIAIAGQVGWDPITEKLVSDDLAQQCRQALANVLTALEAAGGKPEHLIRLTWYVTNREAYLKNLAKIGKAYHDELGAHFPAMSVVVVSALLEKAAQVKVEATAVIPSK
jgi:enamine deaminase RidA (YjgF/YER057c/UK114 family)